MSGLINYVRSKSGVIGMLEHDAGENYFYCYNGNHIAISSEVFNWNGPTVGSNVTYSSGRCTMAVAGLYLITFDIRNNATSTTHLDCNIRLDGTNIGGSRNFTLNTNASTVQYAGGSSTVIKPVPAGGILDIYGSGSFHAGMCRFSAFRLGAS